MVASRSITSCTICGYGFPIADGDAVTLDFEKAKEFLKKHVGSFGQTDEEMQILDALEHAESEDAEEDELEDVMYDIEDSFEKISRRILVTSVVS